MAQRKSEKSIHQKPSETKMDYEAYVKRYSTPVRPEPSDNTDEVANEIANTVAGAFETVFTGK